MRGCCGTVKGDETVCLEQLDKEDCTAACEEGDQGYEVRFQWALRFAALATFRPRCGGFFELLGRGWQQCVVLVFTVRWVVVYISTLVIEAALRHRGESR